MPFVEEFRRKHDLDYVVCSTFHNDFFRDLYPNIKFVDPNTSGENFLINYSVGYFDDGNNLDKNVKNPFSVRIYFSLLIRTFSLLFFL